MDTIYRALLMAIGVSVTIFCFGIILAMVFGLLSVIFASPLSILAFIIFIIIAANAK